MKHFTRAQLIELIIVQVFKQAINAQHVQRRTRTCEKQTGKVMFSMSPMYVDSTREVASIAICGRLFAFMLPD